MTDLEFDKDPLNLDVWQRATANDGTLEIIRIPEGYIYITWTKLQPNDEWAAVSSVFVPLAPPL